VSAHGLRELFRKPGIIRVVAAHNALGAKLAQRAGFDAVWAGGLEISTAHGVPDANILSMAEHLEAARWMVEAVDLPVVADCDTGFGNSNNVIQTVRRYESAGVAAICIEDKLFPKVNSFVAGRQELASVAEFVGKLMAAKNAQVSPDFMVIARIEALIAGYGQAEALRRAQAYADAGADAILIHSSQSAPDQVLEFARAWDNRLPVVVVPTTYFTITAAELEAAGIRMVIYANHGLRAAITAALDTYEVILRTGSTAAVEDRIAPLDLVFELQGMHHMKQAEKAYLRTDMPLTRAVIPAAGDHMADSSLERVARDVPIAMLDVNGKPLMQRQLASLSRCGIRDVEVIAGYRAEQVDAPGAQLTVNAAWRETGDLASIMCSAPDYAGRTLVVYADILFDDQAIRQLLASEDDVTILVDRGFNPARHGERGSVDLVSMAKPCDGQRSLTYGATHDLRKIGKRVPLEEANGEFCGVALFSPAGFAALRNLYAAVPVHEPFQEAASARRASLTDLLQEAVDRGQRVSCVEVSDGWLEIRSFDDYRHACELVAGR
jgi:phosphoenolpyruvate phosphomutase